jgi:hypothetical protein
VGWRLAAAGAAERGLRTVRWVGPSGGDLVRVAHDPVIGSGRSAVRGPRTTDIDRVDVRSVVAVEVYSSPRSVPPEFQMDGAECGVLLIWTTGA